MKNIEQTNKPPKSGFAIASLILGIVSFIPIFGVLLGIIAVVLGVVSLFQIKRGGLGGRRLAIAGLVLGIFGIVFTFIFYWLLFYWGFEAKTGPFAELKPKLSEECLTLTAGTLELYKKKYGKYPESLTELTEAGYTSFSTDAWELPFYYKASPDRQTYELRSLGPDKEYGTKDDVLLKE